MYIANCRLSKFAMRGCRSGAPLGIPSSSFCGAFLAAFSPFHRLFLVAINANAMLFVQSIPLFVFFSHFFGAFLAACSPNPRLFLVARNAKTALLVKSIRLFSFCALGFGRQHVTPFGYRPFLPLPVANARGWRWGSPSRQTAVRAGLPTGQI